jgi:hypothetical protein
VKVASRVGWSTCAGWHGGSGFGLGDPEEELAAVLGVEVLPDLVDPAVVELEPERVPQQRRRSYCSS